MGYSVAVAGATGNVGREMLNILAERSFPADEVIALAASAEARQGHPVAEALRTYALARGIDAASEATGVKAVGQGLRKRFAAIIGDDEG